MTKSLDSRQVGCEFCELVPDLIRGREREVEDPGNGSVVQAMLTQLNPLQPAGLEHDL